MKNEDSGTPEEKLIEKIVEIIHEAKSLVALRHQVANEISNYKNSMTHIEADDKAEDAAEYFKGVFSLKLHDFCKKKNYCSTAFFNKLMKESMDDTFDVYTANYSITKTTPSILKASGDFTERSPSQFPIRIITA